MKRIFFLIALLFPVMSWAQSIPQMDRRVTLDGPTGLNWALSTKADANNGKLTNATIDAASTIGGTAASTIATNANCITTAMCILSPIIKYSPGWIGNVARSLEARLTDTVSLKDFGATGAESTTEDDTPYLQAALTLVCKISGHGGYVFIPAGHYYIAASSGETVPCEGVHVGGAGVRATILHVTGSGSAPIFNFNAPVETGDRYFYQGELDHLSIWGANTSSQTGYAVSVTQCYGCQVHNIETNFMLHSVNVYAGADIGIYHSQFNETLLGGVAINITGSDSGCSANVGGCATRADVIKLSDLNVSAALNSTINTPPAVALHIGDFVQTVWMDRLVFNQVSTGVQVDCYNSSQIGTCPGFIYGSRVEVESNNTNGVANAVGCISVDNASEVEFYSPQCYGSTPSNNLIVFNSSRFQSAMFKVFGGKIEKANQACVVSRVSDLVWSGSTIANCGNTDATSAYAIQLFAATNMDGSGANISNMAFCSVGAGNTDGDANTMSGLYIGVGVRYVTLGTSTARGCSGLYAIDTANTDQTTYNLTGGNVVPH
ncbi:hypothetical protein AA103196_3103 [Ameyamaea chiangmaiensis NBRC 103196]|uniref:Pectate lyase superfamily protein domain-containing protein n=1 Tax=Ameyamaea chiangmaiensis TaxID=442969 RepID=A0A850P3V3_9PROT|nr:hypothetical protein [Ameyamaea chiangmaiensis]MBS4074589.1 hypothetical protein [Ameyamaea chiangmaiensis]NVN39345.1 hypothetical protein [Ameyamaea chiangmaiensis]GBQ72589.1 hypothetical protein AA103196_3103 [Ameyamaea chiangmaiensis NBRC 103196]